MSELLKFNLPKANIRTYLCTRVSASCLHSCIEIFKLDLATNIFLLKIDLFVNKYAKTLWHLENTLKDL